MNYYTDSTEWRYLFRNAIDWDILIPLYYSEFPTSDGFANKEELLSFYEDLLTSTGKWAAETLLPRAQGLDRAGGGKLVQGRVQMSEPLQQTLKEVVEMSLLGLSMDPQYGGMGLPLTMSFLGFEQVSRSCIATSACLGFHTVIAEMIERYCTPDVKSEFIPKILKGEISGSMCMTEPEAGSDVGAVRTTAELQADGTYLLNGNKLFITNGGGGLAFILARIKGAPAGLNGISMFFAQEWIQEKQNYRVTKIEEKMGLHGSTTCEVVYENTIARLVGKENEGFKLMLFLMNEARLSVGVQSLGGIEACLGMVREYVETRKQFGKPLIELPLMKRNVQDWETERDAIRALIVDTISDYDVFQRLHLKKQHTGELNKEETEMFLKVAKIVRYRTPLVKYYPSETFVTLSQKAIQAFGGYGFMMEYPVERLHRDSFGGIIYEGTSQIQALMAMKDFMKQVIKNPKRFIQSMVADHPLRQMINDSAEDRGLAEVRYEFRKNVVSLIMRCFKPEISISENGFRETLVQMNRVFKKEYWQESDRFDRIMAHAETLCQALSYLETLRVLSHHARKDPTRADLYERYRRLVIPRFAAIYVDWKNR